MNWAEFKNVWTYVVVELKYLLHNNSLAISKLF